MDFNKIKFLAKEKQIPLKELASKVGMSEVGLHQAFAANSLKVSVLEKMADVLGVPISFFFGEENKAVGESISAGGSAKIKELENELNTLKQERQIILENHNIKNQILSEYAVFSNRLFVNILVEKKREQLEKDLSLNNEMNGEILQKIFVHIAEKEKLHQLASFFKSNDFTNIVKTL